MGYTLSITWNDLCEDVSHHDTALKAIDYLYNEQRKAEKTAEAIAAGKDCSVDYVYSYGFERGKESLRPVTIFTCLLEEDEEE